MCMNPLQQNIIRVIPYTKEDHPCFLVLYISSIKY